MDSPAPPVAGPAGQIPQPGFCPPRARPYVLVSAVLASSMGFIDGSVVALAMPAIRADLGASLADGQWIHNSYMLLLSALVLLGGAAGDVYGVRNIFLGGIAVFMATSLACAVAPDAQTLIAARAAQGIGAAFMVPGSLALIAKAYPATERGRAIGVWAAFASLTTAFGPFIGGMLLTFGEDWMWRLIFAINVPIGLGAIALLVKVPRDRPSLRRTLDIPGAVLATVGLGLMAWGLTALGEPREGASSAAWMALLLGIVLFAAFVVWERRAPAPMVKLELFRSAAFAGANLYTLVVFFGFNAILFFLPMTVISAWGAREWEASLMFLPLSLFIAAASGWAGRMADRIGPRLPLALGAALLTLSLAGLAATMPLMQLWTVTFPILMLLALGMALLVSPLSAAVMLATPDEDTGLASGINNAVARAAGLIAVAALGAVAGLVFAAWLPPGVAAEFGARTGDLAPAAQAARIAATHAAFQAVAIASACACGVGVVVAWITQPHWAGGRDG